MTKIPPCGAGRVTPKAIDRAPAVAAPTTLLTITRNGSAAAKGMAPSVMNEAPMK